jgi:hypothetical protein
MLRLLLMFAPADASQNQSRPFGGTCGSIRLFAASEPRPDALYLACMRDE